MKMSKVMTNYWPSFMLSLVLLAGIIACLKRLDYIVVEEVRAMVSILFGIATSCFLLSFIWLIQRKPPSEMCAGISSLSNNERPSLHPRGRTDSTGSHTRDEIVVSTITRADLDVPPAYDDALANSKPFNWYAGKVDLYHAQLFSCSCSKMQFAHEGSSTKSNCSCISKLKQPASRREFFLKTTTTLNPAHSPHNSIQTRDGSSSNSRKLSFVQLDVDQLLLSTSPPKYHELQFINQNKSTLSIV